MSNAVYFVGVDVGSSSVRAALVDNRGHVHKTSVREILTWKPKYNFYEQSSENIWNRSLEVIKDVVSGTDAANIKGIGFDATCSLVALDKNFNAIAVSDSNNNDQNVIMWMDHRAYNEANAINKTNHTVLKYVGGKVSLEMQMPKLLWLKNNLSEKWSQYGHFFDLPDFLTWKATGSMSRSLCSLVCKWNYECSARNKQGWNLDFLHEIGLNDLADDNYFKIGNKVLMPGEYCGGLTNDVACIVGLKTGTPVATSIIDAHAGGLGMIGARAQGIDSDKSSRLCLICGSSTCHMAVNKDAVLVEGVWGPYYSAMVPNMWLNEAGQSASGILLDHIIESHPAGSALLKTKSSGEIRRHLRDILLEMAKKEGLSSIDFLTKEVHVWPDFHGNRSPLADPTMRGMMTGLTINSNEENLAVLYLATLQALSYGTRHIIDALIQAGYKPFKSLLVCGGIIKDPLFVSTQADAASLPILQPHEKDSVLVGSAILGACASQYFPNIQDAIHNMGGTADVIQPDSNTKLYHDKKYRIFLKMYQDQLEYRSIMNSQKTIFKIVIIDKQVKMSKRGADEGGNGSSQPPIKKVHFEPHLIGPVSTLEEMDIKVLQFQNKKLAQRIEQRHRCEAELRARIEQLEKRQTQDDAVLCVVNRYWNLLNEDIRVLLQRFDAETADESENKNENEATTSFLMQLSTWDKEELDAQLANRVQVSKRAVAKVLQAFDRLQQRNDKIWRAIKGDGDGGAAPSLDATVRAANEEVTAENRRLQGLCTALHEAHHAMTLRVAALHDSLNSRDTENAELKNQIDDLQYELMKVRSRNDKLENHLAEAIEKLKSYHQSGVTTAASAPAHSGAAAAKLEDVAAELEEQRELANNRLAELDRLHRQHRDTLKEVEKLKMDIRQLPESVIVETTEYKCLQSQFSVLYNESMQMKTALDETRLQLQNAKNLHMRQIEMMESEELSRQKALRAEMIQLEDVLGQLRKEYEMLRIEFEQNLAANEQTGPINREMRHLITSLQNHNQQLKGEVHRYKRKYKDTSQELNKARKEVEEANTRGGERGDEKPLTVKKEEPDPEGDDVTCGNSAGETKLPLSKDHGRAKMQEQEQIIKDLKQQLKKAVNEQKELKLLLDMYKGVSKEQRDKVQLMAAERKARQELEDHRQKAKMAQESKRERRMADEDALRKIKQLEEQKYELQKQLSCARPNADALHGFSRPFAGSPEEEALLNEMEVTGQAFEDMQEQNSRLIQQLREKDDANFKLMSERIKANSLHKLLREEKQLLQEQVITRDQQIESMGAVARRLEEKERLLQATLSAVEKELLLRQQAMEMHKRKAIESAQSAADLKLHLEKYHAQMKEAQQVVAEKTSALEAEAYKTKRLHEELAILRRKAERMKKMEQAGSSMDEVLLEEIREYKETLTCPSCKVKRKDAVLTKCFHVFCWDCLRTRYETRQRKCPKCNAAFGANDYHRLYLST